MSTIILTTINARYIHSAFGLRYLYANMGELQSCSKMLEFGLKQQAIDICQQLLSSPVKIIGFGVYIWNVLETQAVIAILKQLQPELVIILGGPEVSYPPDLPDLVTLADYIITGAADNSFAQLCRQLLSHQPPSEKIITSPSPALSSLASPYPYYNDIDIKQRVIYVEASRGCPYKCEFCLSALDITAKAFELNSFLNELDQLYQRGARNFKFIDRTFNLKIASSVAILEFFLSRLSDNLHLHFEMIPDYLPEALKTIIKQFPAGVLQFEVGVQSFDPLIQHTISRKQDNALALENLSWLRQHSMAHIHADLIVGLPGDTLDNFAKSFDQLVAIKPQEIQVGILKRLRGAPINRHTEAYQLRYDPNPPYTILATGDMDFFTLQRLKRFARYWDIIANSGRFSHTLPVILDEQPFARFLQLSDQLYQLTGSTFEINLKRLFELLYRVMTDSLKLDQGVTESLLLVDYQRNGEKGLLSFMQKTPKAEKMTVKDKRQRRF